MSNRVPPILNTILDPLPKENIIIPLNLRSKQINSFPPLKTPKLQELKKEIITFPIFRGIKYLKLPKITKKIKKTKIDSDDNYVFKFLFYFLNNIFYNLYIFISIFKFFE
uniref:Uncharacterized protein n=1 Tax=viral metagenome TaxID=1070528 RepID=A0A6C0GZK7_9ZZZZ